MAGHKKEPTPFPSDEEILRFVHESTTKIGKRDIARHFHLDSYQKMLLKKRLRVFEADGTLLKARGKRYEEPGTLPEVCVIEISGVDSDGDLLAKPTKWDHETPRPIIHMKPEKRGQTALGIGDRVLARLTALEDNKKDAPTTYEASTIRRLSNSAVKVMGVLEEAKGSFRLRPTDRRNKSELIIDYTDAGNASVGDLVRAELLPGKRLGLKQARVIESLASTKNMSAASIIAIHDHGLPTEFSPEAQEIAEKAKPASMSGREDLRKIPLITIDGADARDFDDAVWAEPDTNPTNKGGWHIIVAIADVAWYVRPGSALDKDAYERGNSVYFPDRVVPMLPEALSNGLCSLVPHEDRPCMAVHLWLNPDGTLKKHRFCRAMMRSHARFTYEQVQLAHDGAPDEHTEALYPSVIAPLYEAYAALAKARDKRGALDLDLPERQVIIGDDGNVQAITVRERFDSHRLIEEFMITANVAAAEALEDFKQPCMYRAHDQPSMEKMESLREFLGSLDISLPKGQVIRAQQFNQILKKVANTPQQILVNTTILRSQSQAEYSPVNIGHFGLNLHKYSHFTSPIRRYSDLLVHRALISGLNLKKPLNGGELGRNHPDFDELGTHISQCERRASVAERDATDRFVAGYMADQIGNEFIGHINGVTRFGLFIRLSGTGAEGLIPVSTLPNDFYVHDEKMHCLRGERTGRTFTLGQSLKVVLLESVALTGGMILRLGDNEGGSRHSFKQTQRRENPKNKQKKKHKRLKKPTRNNPKNKS